LLLFLIGQHLEVCSLQAISTNKNLMKKEINTVTQILAELVMFKCFEAIENKRKNLFEKVSLKITLISIKIEEKSTK
jgi:hypothetical protein